MFAVPRDRLMTSLMVAWREWRPVPIFNPRRACARVTVLVNPRRACARITVLVLSVCLCVCFPYSGTSRNQAYKQQYQRLQRDTGMKLKRDFSLKRFVPKLWRRLLTSSNSGVVSGILVPFFRRN